MLVASRAEPVCHLGNLSHSSLRYMHIVVNIQARIFNSKMHYVARAFHLGKYQLKFV